ncbi:MAG TPA: glycosyltransferase, partial [Saprospiraceae bacterium]|nr:glycosyltransferase [Saprospiraceae bacterium]
MDKSDQILMSVVSPVYRGANVIDELVERIVKSVEKITQNYEIILVEDDGPDDSWQKITQICSLNTKV